MNRCHSQKSDGSQCSRECSNRSETDPNLCWQHQKKQSSETPTTSHSSPKSDLLMFLEMTGQKPENNSRQLKVLSGPISFYYYPSIDGKRVLLLGDQHRNGTYCNKDELANISKQNSELGAYEIHDWLWDLSKVAPECLDIFNETGYFPINQKGGEPLKSYDSPLEAISDSFLKCVYNKQCSDRMRYHYIDIRQFMVEKGDDDIISESQLLDLYFKKQTLDDLSKYLIFEKKWNRRNKIEILLKYYIGLDRKYFAKKTFSEYCKDYAKAVDEPIKTYKIDLEVKRIWKLIDKELSKTTLDKNKFFEIMLPIAIENVPISMIGSSIVDIYVLLRLFIKFNENKMIRGPNMCQSNQIVENAIIYAGDYHIQDYVSFFHNYFGIDPYISYPSKNDTQCLHLSKPFDYFANQYFKQVD